MTIGPLPADMPVLGAGKARWLVAGVLLVAVVLRVGVVVATRDSYVPETDAAAYDLIATSLADGDGFGEATIGPADGASAFRPPGYPASLAVVYAVAGPHSWTAGRLANAVISTAMVGVLGLVAALLLGRRVGLVTMALAAVHPLFLLHASGLQLEPLLVTLELAALAAALQHRRRPRGVRWAVAAGGLVGLAVLTREIAVFMLPVIVLLLWDRPRHLDRRALAAPALVVLIAAAVVVPWTIRNAAALGGFFPVTSGNGYALAGTYNPTSRDLPDDPWLWLPPEVDPGLFDVIMALPDRSEKTLDGAMRAEAVDFITEHPGSLAEAFWWNTVRLFDVQGPRHAVYIGQFLPYPTGLTRVAVYASYLVYLGAAAGALLPPRRRIPRAIWLFPVLIWVSISFISANLRYRASIEPFLLLLAAGALVHAADRWTARRGGAVGPAAPGAARPARAAR